VFVRWELAVLNIGAEKIAKYSSEVLMPWIG
jgi:hypothetical protein